jgi:hypothetical protein
MYLCHQQASMIIVTDLQNQTDKLLFYKEVHKYRKWVESYYAEIKAMPNLSQQDFGEMLGEESKKHQSIEDLLRRP